MPNFIVFIISLNKLIAINESEFVTDIFESLESMSLQIYSLRWKF